MGSDVVLFVVIIVTIFWTAVFLIRRKGLRKTLEGYSGMVKVASILSVFAFTVAVTSAACLGIVFLSGLILR